MLAQRAAIGGVLMIAARLITRLVDLATMIMIARLLLPEDFGLVAIAMSLVTIVETVLELPLNQALVRLSEVSRSHYDTAFSLSLIRSALLAGILLAAAYPFARIYGDHRLMALISLLSLAPIARGLVSPRLAEYQKSMSFWRDFVIELAGKLVGFAASVGIAFATRSYWSIAAGTISYPVATAISSYYLAPYRPRLSLSRIAVFLDFVGWMSAAQLISSLNWQSERLLVGKVGPISRLGLFTTASDLSTIPILAFFGPVLRPLLAAFSQIRDDPQKLARSYQTVSCGVVALGLPVLVGQSLLAGPTIRLLLGAHWVQSAPLLRWLSLSLIPGLFALPSISLVMAFGRTRLVFFRNGIEFLSKIPCLLIAVIEFGVVGIAAARFVSELTAGLFSLRTVRQLTGITLRQQILGPWRSMVSALVMAPVIAISARYWSVDTGPLDRIADVIAPAGCGALAYGATLFSIWILTGAPPGLESMVIDLCSGRRLRQRPA